MADRAQKEKEKGNAAFKAGDYPSAIGHYTAAVLADRKDPTYPLNRAAAYLKLGKYEDAERDCNTVLGLSTKNVKAHFRRGQAKVGLEKFIEAQRDFTEALRLEPDNQATKEELKRVAEIIETEKRKKSGGLRQVDATVDSTLHPSPTPKRRRVPITIVEPPASSINDSASPVEQERVTVRESPKASALGIQESSFRLLKTSAISAGPELKSQSTSQAIASTSTPTSSSTPSPSVSSPPVTPTAAPKATSFAQAKQTREAKTSKVGGGIFRSSGQNTIFPTRAESSSPLHPSPSVLSPSSREIPTTKSQDEEKLAPVKDLPSPATTSSNLEPLHESVPSSGNGSASNQPPTTLFDLIRAWRSMLTSAERWKLLQTIPPSNMPSFCKTSLEPTLLVSILEVFLVVLSSQPMVDDTNRIREYMDGLAKVPRFSTLVMFLSGKEKAIAKEVWRKLGVQGKPSGVWNALGDLNS